MTLEEYIKIRYTGRQIEKKLRKAEERLEEPECMMVQEDDCQYSPEPFTAFMVAEEPVAYKAEKPKHKKERICRKAVESAGSSGPRFSDRGEPSEPPYFAMMTMPSASPAAPQFALEETFSQALLKLIDKKGMTDVECYTKAFIDRRQFSKIRKPNYKPGKKTALALAVALELTIDETNDLLKKAGLSLSPSLMFDVIVEYYIKEGKYNLFAISDALAAYDQPGLIS